jgi:hypothetical protein
MLETVALALVGCVGSQLTAALGAVVSRFTLIRLVRGLPDPQAGPVTVLGVDDVAKRRDRSYATVLMDMDSQCLTGMLPDREAGYLRGLTARTSGHRDGLPRTGRCLRPGRPGGSAWRGSVARSPTGSTLWQDLAKRRKRPPWPASPPWTRRPDWTASRTRARRYPQTRIRRRNPTGSARCTATSAS